MLQKIKNYQQEINNLEIKNPKELESFRIKFISKKSVINDLFQKFKFISNHEKREVGVKLNNLKLIAKQKLLESSVVINDNSSNKNFDEDLSLPPKKDTLGSLHPIRIIGNKIINIFGNIGFSIEDGPEILFKELCHAIAVSSKSAGLHTLIPGIILKDVICSTA